MLTIRRSTADDTETIHRFNVQLQEHLYSSNPDTWRRNPDTQQYREGIIREASDPEVYTLIAEIDGKPVGYISSRIMDRQEPAPQKVGVVMNAYIELEHRGKGVATALMKQILDHFTESGVEEATLRYIIGNREAERYWKSLGFKPIIKVANVKLETLKANLQKRPSQG